jgi:hypothetical protein
MVKQQIRELLESGADVDELTLSLIEALHETLEFKTDNKIKKEPVVMTINQLRQQVVLLMEQKDLNVGIESEEPTNETALPQNASADDDFVSLAEQVSSLEITEEVNEELEILEREARNGSQDVNQRNDFIRELHSIYDGFDLEKQPEGKTFALIVSTTRN